MSSRSSLRRKLLYSTGCLGAQTSVMLSFLFVFSSITILFLSKHKDFTVNAQIAYGHDLRSDIVDVGVEKREYWLMSTRSASSNPRAHCCFTSKTGGWHWVVDWLWLFWEAGGGGRKQRWCAGLQLTVAEFVRHLQHYLASPSL